MSPDALTVDRTSIGPSQLLKRAAIIRFNHHPGVGRLLDYQIACVLAIGPVSFPACRIFVALCQTLQRPSGHMKDAASLCRSA